MNSLLPGPTLTEGVEQFLREVAAKDAVSVEEATNNYFKWARAAKHAPL